MIRNSSSGLAPIASLALAALRIVTGLLFFEHGLAKLTGFPSDAIVPPALSLLWFVGLLEFFGGLLILAGFRTRLVAFLLSGEMAIAYFSYHLPQSFYPLVNQGGEAILFCFVFLYLAAAGAGSLSIDAKLAARRAD